MTMSKPYHRQSTIEAAEQLVRTKMASYDPSHDPLHVWRVRRLALKIVECETSSAAAVYAVAPAAASTAAASTSTSSGTPTTPISTSDSSSPPTIDVDVVELAALFHDLQDHKYTGASGVPGTSTTEMFDLMTKNPEGGLSVPRAELVLKIINNTSYSTEKRLREAGEWGQWHQNCVELHCVQDADRLDAIGSFGVFRAAAYSTAVNRPLYAFVDDTVNDASTEQELAERLAPAATAPTSEGKFAKYKLQQRPQQNKESAYQHFHDKLFTMKDTMKTNTGMIVANRRQEIMVKAIEAMDSEFHLSDFP